MITTTDYKRISDLLLRTSLRGKLPILEEKLHTMKVIPSSSAPKDLVTMNTEVTVHDLTLGEVMVVRLVYKLLPLYQHQTSILAPLGATLLGMRVNQNVKYKLRDGAEREIHVMKVVFQPEASGMFEL